MKRSASAVWQGDLKGGRGSLSAPGGVLKDTRYSFAARFQDEPGTNPEELIAAAHAGCFAMALSGVLGEAGFTPERLEAKATVTLEQVGGKWTITHSHLDLTARIPGIDEAKFREAAEGAKANCPVSRVLNAKIDLEARLEG